MMLVSFLPAAAQLPETRGRRPEAVYGSTRSGIDIRSGWSIFVMNSNHVHDNGYEGMICTECSGVSIGGNKMEQSKEAGTKLFLRTKSAGVSNNVVSCDEKFGIYLRNNRLNATQP